MKTIRNKLLLIIYVASFMFMASCCKEQDVDTNSQINVPPIKVVVVGGPKLKVIDGGNCSSPGCIEVAKGDTAKVTFILRSSPGWYFTKFTICKDTDPDQDDDLLCKLLPPEIADFKFSYGSKKIGPNAKGDVDLASLSSDPLTDFDLEDANVVPNNYFYAIKVCKPDGDNEPICADTDPPIRNKGM